MAEFNKSVSAWTEKKAEQYTGSTFNRALNTVASSARGAYDIAADAVLLTLSKAWIGISATRPAKTNDDKAYSVPSWLQSASTSPEVATISASTPTLDRFDYTKLWSLRLEDYFMPLSQTFDLKAKKRLNVSSLVDGIDIIQQTRKESKTLNVRLRLTLRPGQSNLHIVNVENEMQTLSDVLSDLYESDQIFSVNGDMINNTCGVTHVIMEEYELTMRTGMMYNLNMKLREVIYADNVVTFNLREIDSEVGTRRQLTD